MSLDGHLTRPPGESQWLTSESARAHAHKLRAVVDAIIVGAETIRLDNPRLTVRSGARRVQPLRVILTKSGRLPRTAKVFCNSNRDRTLIWRNKTLRSVVRDLGRRKITSVLIEGGGDVLSQALDQRLISLENSASKQLTDISQQVQSIKSIRLSHSKETKAIDYHLNQENQIN